MVQKGVGVKSRKTSKKPYKPKFGGRKKPY